MPCWRKTSLMDRATKWKAVVRALPIDEIDERKINRSIDDNQCQLID